MFIEVGISATSTKIYTQTFSSKEITRDSLHILDRTMLKELGIKTMYNMLTILKFAKEPSVPLVSYITGQASKKGTALVQPDLHMDGKGDAEVTALKNNNNNNTYRLNSPSLMSRWQMKNKTDHTKWAGKYLCWYRHFCATIRCPGNRLNHMHLMKFSGGHETFPFLRVLRVHICV